MKGGLFTCKCGKANCSFSDETINNLHIDSDNEEVDLDGNTEENIIENNEMSNKDLIDISERDKNISYHKTRSSKNDNFLEQGNEHSCSSSNESSSATPNNSKISNNNSSKPKNGLRAKNKSVSPKIVKKNGKNLSNDLLKVIDSHSAKMLESKLIQNKFEQVMLKKGLAEKMLNGNSNSTNGELTFTTVTSKKKSSAQVAEKNKMCNGSKISVESVQSTNNKTVKSYELRTKVSSSDKKNSENTKTKGAVSHDVILRSCDIRNNREVSVSSDTSGCNQNTTKDTNDCSQLVDFIKTEPDDGGSDTELKMVNGEHKSAETPLTSERECDKVKSGEILDIKKNFKKDSFSCNDQNNWSSIDVIK